MVYFDNMGLLINKSHFMPFINSKYDYEKQRLSKIDSAQKEKEAEQREMKGTSIMPPEFSPTANDSSISKETYANVQPNLYNHVPKTSISGAIINRTSRSDIESEIEPTEQNLNQNSSTSTRDINPLDHLLQDQEENIKSIESSKPSKESTKPLKDSTYPKYHDTSTSTKTKESQISRSMGSFTSKKNSSVRKISDKQSQINNIQKSMEVNKQYNTLSNVLIVLGGKLGGSTRDGADNKGLNTTDSSTTKGTYAEISTGKTSTGTSKSNQLTSSYIPGGSVLSSAISSKRGRTRLANTEQKKTSLAQNQLESNIEKYESSLQSVGDDAQLANIDLQNRLQKQQQTLQTISKISKMLHDTAMAIIRKIG